MKSSSPVFMLKTNLPEKTFELGRQLARFAYPGLLLLLFGDLGAGKTQLSKGIGFELGFFDVRSPTFILLARHEGALPLVHADLYRLESSAVPVFELEECLEEGSLLVVEWGERWLSPPDEDRWDVRMQYGNESEEEGSIRSVSITAYGRRAEEQLLFAVQGLKDTGWRVGL